jgi:hypothetical protein
MEVTGQLHTPAVLHLKNISLYPLIRALCQPQNRSERFEQEQNRLPLTGNESENTAFAPAITLLRPLFPYVLTTDLLENRKPGQIAGEQKKRASIPSRGQRSIYLL